MRQTPLIIAVAACAASSSGAMAAATPEGAKAMEAGYAAFLTQAVIDEGLLSIEPEGDDYVVTWDIQKAIDESKPTKGEVTVEPFSYRLTPGPGGSWIFKSAKLPKVVFETDTDKGHSSGVIDFNQFNLDGLFDPAAAPFLRGECKGWRLKRRHGLDRHRPTGRCQTGRERYQHRPSRERFGGPFGD